MSASNDDIRVRIAGDLADINKSLRDLKRETKRTGATARNSRRDWQVLGKGLTNVRSQMTRLARRAGGVVAGFLAVRNIVQGVQRSLTSLEDTARQSRALGTTAERFQELLFTFREFRLDGNDVSDALATLADRARDAQDGMQSFIDDFRLLGIEVEDLRGLRPDQIFDLVAERVAGIEDPTRRAAGVVRIFGDDLGRRLNPLLLEGAQGLENYAQQAREAGAVISDELVANGAEASRQFRALRAELGARFTAAVAENTDQIIRLAQGLGSAAEGTLDLLDNLNELFGGLRNTSVAELRTELRQLQEIAERGVFSRTGVFRTSAGIELFFSQSEIQAEIERVQAEIERQLQSSRIQDRITPFAERRRLAASGDRGTAPSLPDQRRGIARLQSDLAAAGKLLADEVKRTTALLDADLERNLVAFSDYYRQRTELEQRAIGQQIEQQQAALRLIEEELRLATERGGEVEAHETKRAALVAQITVLERQRADVATRAARDQAVAERALAEQLEQVRIRLAELQGDTVGARTAQLENEFRDLLQRLEVEGDAAGEALVRRLIDVETAKAELAEFETEYQRSLANLQRAEQRVNIQTQTGVIGEREARRQIIELHRQTAAEVEALIPRMRALAEATGDPAAIDRVEQLELQLLELRATADTVGRELEESFRDAAEGAFADFISGAASAKDAFDNLVDTIRQRLSQLIAERLFDRLFQSSGQGGGGGGGNAGFFANLASAFLHDGGVVGRDGRKRQVPALAFAGAPRLHRGTFPGLGPNEVPAVLERGEGVLSRRQMREGGLGRTEVNVYARDAESFSRSSPTQLAAETATMLARAARRNR